MSYFDLYKIRMSVNGNNIADKQKNDSVNFINKTFKDSPGYRVVDINGVNVEVRVVDGKNSSDKDLLLKPSTVINKGSVVSLDNNKWLVIDSLKNEIYPKIKIQLTNETLKWKDSNNLLQEVPCIVTKSLKFDLEENNFDINLPQGSLLVLVPYSSLTTTIKLKQRFILGSQAYEVTGIDDVTNAINGVGLIQFSVTLTTKTDQDNITDGLASSTPINGGGGLW